MPRQAPEGPTPAPGAGTAERLLGRPAVKLKLALASLLILGVGALIAPGAAPRGLSTPQERAAPLLEEQVRALDAAPPFRGVQEVARQVRGNGVTIPAAQPTRPLSLNDFSAAERRPGAAGFGVFVSDTEVLTHASALHGRSVLQVSTADGATFGVQLAAYEPATGLALLRTGSSSGSPATFATDAPEPGALAAAVGRGQDRDWAVPVFITSLAPDRYSIGGADDAVLPGMPVYNLDGQLIAIAGGTAGQAFAAREARDRLTALASAGGRQASFGLAVQDLTGRLTGPFGGKGVLVNGVVAGGPAARAGILPGDALLAIDEDVVDNAEMAIRRLASAEPGKATALRLVRSGKTRTIEVTPATAFEMAALAHDGADLARTGPEAGTLFPLAVLDAAGVPPEARVLTLNGRAVSSRAEAQRELRRAAPSIVLLRLQGEQYFAALETAR